MTQSPRSGGDTASAQAEVAAASRLFLASSRNIPIRLTTSAAMAIAATPVMPWQIPALWWAVIGLSALLELRLVKAVEKGARLMVWEGMPVPSVALSMAIGSWYAAFMAAFWLSGNPIARAFAIAQTCISILYVLLQYYARPKIFLLSASPYFTVMALAVGSM